MQQINSPEHRHQHQQVNKWYIDLFELNVRDIWPSFVIEVSFLGQMEMVWKDVLAVWLRPKQVPGSGLLIARASNFNFNLRFDGHPSQMAYISVQRGTLID